jgi:hypothetical protein
MSHSDAFYDAAIYYNRKNAVALPDFTPNPTDSRGFVDVVVTFQEANDLKVDGKLGPNTATLFRQELMDGGATKALVYDDLVEIAEVVSKFEGKFWSLNRDGEFRGLFDRPPERYHWASENNPKKEHGTHIGLSFGFIQYTQDGGKLGVLLQRMFDTAPIRFAEIFGEHHGELLERTAATGKKRKLSDINGKGMRSPRVWPVGGHDLWVGSYWGDRFKEAGHEKVFQRCQVEIAVDDYLIPGLRLCEKFDLCSERAIAMVFDRCVQYGPSGADKKLLRPAFDAFRGRSGGEHAFLKFLEDRWEGKRWHHRTEKLWRHPDFWDGPCDWGGVDD